MSNTAFIYDAIRTPRSKGKPSGTLHEVKPIDLGAGRLNALQERNDLDTSYVDDGAVSITEFFKMSYVDRYMVENYRVLNIADL